MLTRVIARKLFQQKLCSHLNIRLLLIIQYVKLILEIILFLSLYLCF